MSDLLLPILSGIKNEMETMNKSLAKMNKTHVQTISEEWVTAAQVMFTLKVCKRTLETLKRNGLLPYSKIRGTLYFRVTDIENLLQQHYVNPSSTDNNSTFNSQTHACK